MLLPLPEMTTVYSIYIRGVIVWKRQRKTTSEEKCTRQHALIVDKRPKFLSNLPGTGLFIAGTVSGTTSRKTSTATDQEGSRI